MKTIIYSGTFDPPTNGHIGVIKELAKIPDVDTIYIAPSFNPLKQQMSPFINRIEMCELAFQNISENVLVSKIENELFEMTKGYTYNLVTELIDYCGSDISIVIGYDLVDEIPKSWFNGNKIIEEFKFIIIPRNDSNGVLIEPKEQWYKNHTIIEVEPTKYSSSEIRGLIKSNTSVNDLLPLNVIEYIKSKGLYGN